MLNRRGVYLRNLVENKGHEEVTRILMEALATNELKLEEFSFLETAYAFMGAEWLANLASRDHGGFGGHNTPLFEAGAVDSTAFSNITGQIIYSATMEGYKNPMFIGDQLVTVTPTNLLDGEKIAGITEPQGEVEDVAEGMPFPRLGVAEDYIETPATAKMGFIIGLTKEALLKDRTGLIMDRARMVGERVAMRREKKILDVVLGITNNYKRKGTSMNTFLTSGAYINKVTGNELVNWTDIEVAELLFNDITNPDQTDDSEPVVFTPNTLVVMPFKRHTARQIVNATSLEQRTPTTQADVRHTPNSVEPYTIISSPIAQQRLVKSGVAASDAKNYWQLGNHKKAFRYMQVYPVQVTQAPLNHPDEFDKDVVLQYKASERGVAVAVEPRHVVLCTA